MKAIFGAIKLGRFGMGRFVKFIVLVFWLVFWASIYCTQASEEILEIRPGDVILISLNCSVCPLIENETDSPYSHSGIIVQKESGVVMVAQALGRGVHHVPLDQFLSTIRPEGVAHIFRTRELDQLYHRNPEAFKNFEQDLWKTYQEQFLGLPFDPYFLWENSDTEKRERLYCSEFVAKLLNHSLHREIRPVPMDFSRNFAAWSRLFRGAVPQGKPGLAPSDFSKNRLLFFVNAL
ncbi:MAG: YiiX/YebB-like N1pC/P60 family cysteine hydrolase [Bdellovibrionota bacterium]